MICFVLDHNGDSDASEHAGVGLVEHAHSNVPNGALAST